jgi:hypothetical protein
MEDTNPQVSQDAAVEHMRTIVPNFDKTLDVRDFKFNFKKDEFGNKRPSVELKLPVPSVEGLISIIEVGGKGLDLLLDAAADIVVSQARTIVNDKEDISQDTFPMQEVLWDFIANMPKAERRGGGISKEVWESFAKDYVEVMPSVTGKTSDQVANAAKILLNKFAQVKNQKPVIKLLKDQLSIYITNSTNAETYSECVDFLLNKADTLLNITEADLLANL